MPWNRGFGFLSLNPPTTEANVRAIQTVHDGKATGWEVSLSLEVKIPPEPDSLRHAAEHLLGKSDDEIRSVVRHVVESNVPALLARMPADPPGPDWERLAAEVEACVAPELVDYGLVVRSVSVTGLQRIQPVSSLARVEEPRHEESPSTDRSTVEVAQSDFALRLARVERGLSIMGAQVVRMVREPVPGALSDGTALNAPSGEAETALEATSEETYDSTGSGRPPRVPRPTRVARSTEEA